MDSPIQSGKAIWVHEGWWVNAPLAVPYYVSPELSEGMNHQPHLE